MTQTADDVIAAYTDCSRNMTGADIGVLVAEVTRLRTERDKFEKAWSDVADRYEALLNQLGATDA